MSSATGARLQSPGTLLPDALLVAPRVPETRPGLCVYRHLVCVSGGPRWAQLRLAARHEDIGDPLPPPCLKKAFSLPLHLHDEGGMSSATGARLQSPGTLLPEALLVAPRVYLR